MSTLSKIGQKVQAATSHIERDDLTRHLLLTALLGLSWWSTTQGMLALMAAGNGAPGLLVQGTIGFAVMVLTVLISWTVHMIRMGRTGAWAPMFGLGYALLTCISVGFGFGFYWTHIESRASAQRAAQEETARLSRTLTTAYGSLGASMDALDAVASMSEARAVQEAKEGGTCGIGGVAGPGPRYRLRMNDAATMRALRDQIANQVGGGFVESRGTSRTLFGTKASLDAQLLRLEQGRFAAMDERSARQLLMDIEGSLALAVDQYEAFRKGASVTHAVGLLRTRVEQGRGVMSDDGAQFTCPDPGLEVVMVQAADTLEQLPSLPPTDLSVPIGADATVAAFGKLANTALGPLGAKTAPKLAGRDLVPLGVAIAVDLFILLLSVQGRRPPGARDPQAVATWLDQPQAVRQLMGQSREAQLPTHTELLEHTFWWRGAYHLALPVAGAGEGPLTAAQQGMTLLAMVMTDAGLLTPVQKRFGKDDIRQKLLSRFDKKRTWVIRRAYQLYRFEENGLARMTSLLLSEGAGGAQPDGEEPESADWRQGLYPVRKAAPVRPFTPITKAEATQSDQEDEGSDPVRPGPKPSAYWRSLKPIPKKAEE